jgi:hypothetical protein
MVVMASTLAVANGFNLAASAPGRHGLGFAGFALSSMSKLSRSATLGSKGYGVAMKVYNVWN